MDSKLRRKTFGVLIFSNLIQKEDISQTGSSENCQSITHAIILHFYWHNKKDDQFMINFINSKTKLRPDTLCTPEWYWLEDKHG